MDLGSLDDKESACSEGDLGWIPGLGRTPGVGDGNPLQCSCLENPRDGGAWWAAIRGVAQSPTRPKQLSSSSCVKIVQILIMLNWFIVFFRSTISFYLSVYSFY